MKKEITQELVKELFDYHEDGYLIWKIRPANRVKIGDIAGNVKMNKRETRRYIIINHTYTAAARLIFLYRKGYMPEIVDHEDRNPMNDKISNLRDADRFKNTQNSTSRKNSTSKYLGVCWHSRDKNWMAQIQVKLKKVHLKQFNTEIEAALAYNRAAVKYFGEFANLNIIMP